MCGGSHVATILRIEIEYAIPYTTFIFWKDFEIILKALLISTILKNLNTHNQIVSSNVCC